MYTLFAVLVILALLAVAILSVVATVVGIIHSFKTRWWLGIAALIIPGFSFIVGGCKLGGLDLLESVDRRKDD